MALKDLFCFIVFRDGDGVLNEFDNCPDLPNGEQADTDGDKKGDGNFDETVLLSRNIRRK